MTEQKIIDELNKIIEIEDGNSINPEDLISSSEIDSFGFSMFIIEVNERYNIWTQQEVEDMDYKNLTIQMVIDRIKEKV